METITELTEIVQSLQEVYTEQLLNAQTRDNWDNETYTEETETEESINWNETCDTCDNWLDQCTCKR